MTTIINYLKETEFASRKLMEAIWDDLNRAEQLKVEIEKEAGTVEREYDRTIAIQQYTEDLDDIIAGVGLYWANYFGADEEVYDKNEKLTDFAKLLAAREFFLATLCGSILELGQKRNFFGLRKSEKLACGKSR